MLNIGTSALISTQGALSTTSHNISNVNTDGYNRQRVEQSTRLPNFEGGYYIGSGSTISSVERIFDDFLSDQVRTFTSQEQQFNTFSTYARQVDDLLGSPELSLNSGLQEFFDSVQEVANDPTSIAARQVMLTGAGILTNRFNTLDSQLDAFNDQVNGSLDATVKEVNLLSVGIASLNQAIIEASGGAGIPPNDLMDQRDQLINELSELVSVATKEQSNGAVNVFIGTGQSLVVGQSVIDLKIVTDPLDPGRNEIGYGPSGINISAQLTGGSIGGLLSVRQTVIEPARAEIDALAAGMVEHINAQHTTGLTLDGNAGGNFFEPAIPIPPATTPIPDAGSIRLGITDPRDIAVAYPVEVTTNITNTGTGQIEVAAIDSSDPLFDATSVLSGSLSFVYDAVNKAYTISYDGNTAGAITLPYDSATDSSNSFDLAALVPPLVNALGDSPTITITLSGVPSNVDSFTIDNSTSGGFSSVGDNRNGLALAELQVGKVLNGGKESFGDAYGILVANVATRTHQADVSQQTQKGLLEQTSLRFESVSGVNLDEEAANLIKFQQAYQAASQIITVSNTVFDSLLGAIR